MIKVGGTGSVRVIPAFGTVEIAEGMQRAAAAAAAGQCLVVAGIVPIRHRPPTQHRGWQVSLSHWGRRPVVVSRNRFKHHAKAQLWRARRASCDCDLRDDATFAAVIQELAAFGDEHLGF